MRQLASCMADAPDVETWRLGAAFQAAGAPPLDVRMTPADSGAGAHGSEAAGGPAGAQEERPADQPSSA